MTRPAYRHEVEGRASRRMRANVFARIVRTVLDRQLPVILIWVALAAAGMTYCLTTTSLDMRASDLVMPGRQAAEAERAFAAAFPETDAPIAAVVESADPGAAREAAAGLARAMSAEPASFSNVFAPGTGRFFDEYGVLYLDAAAVEDIVARIEQSAPLYRAIAASPNLAGLATLAAQAARAIAEGRSPQGLNALFEEAALTVKGQIGGQRHDLDWPTLVEHSARLDSTQWYVLAVPVAAAGEIDPGRHSVLRARALASEFAADPKVSITLTGLPVLRAEGETTLGLAILLPILVAGLLVLVVLAFGLSRLGLIVASLLSFILSSMTFLGAVALIAPRLDRVTALSPIVFLGMAMLALIAVALRAEEHEKSAMASGPALVLAAHRIGPALLAWTIAIPAGCLAAYLTAFSSLAALALITAAASFIAFAAAFTLLPALLGYLSTSYEEGDVHWLDIVLEGPPPPAWRKLRQGSTVVLIVIAVMFTALLPQLDIETREAPRLPDGANGRLFRELAASEPSLLGAAQVLAKPGEEARELAVRLAALPEVASVRWIESFLPPGEAQKRQILGRIQGVLPKVPDQTAEAEEDALRSELDRLEQNLLVIANDPKTAPDLNAAASEFRRSLALFDGPNPASPDAIRRLENAMFVRLPLLFERVERLSNLPRLTPTMLDPDIVGHHVGRDGSWRIEAAPRDGVDRRRFAEAVRAVAPNATGSAFADLGRPRLMLRALGLCVIAMLALSVVAAILLGRSILAGLRVGLPPLLAALAAAGAMVLGGRSLIPEDISVIIATIAMIIGSGLIAERWDRQASAWTSENPSTLPRAQLVPEIAFAAFATLMLSTWQAFRNVGEMVLIAAVLQLAATFIIAPTLVRWTRRHSHGRRGDTG